jgi:ubiquinone/menaquinone biosynthesis C-methylase UbiE
MTKKASTSWGNEAKWYQEHLEQNDTYHAQVILPNLLRLVQPAKGLQILEIGCGEGFFSREFARAGGEVTASDISPELIELGKKQGGGVTYVVSKAQDLSWAKEQGYDVVVAVLTLQNMERIDDVMKEVRRVLKKNGRFVFVLNHPVLRIPKATHWEYDAENKIQCRKLEAYLSSKKITIDMHPGKKGKQSVTYSFHRSLQEYMKILRGAGFCIVRLEEWISHRTSEKGPRSIAEDRARKEFPLFMMIEASPYNLA